MSCDAIHHSCARSAFGKRVEVAGLLFLTLGLAACGEGGKEGSGASSTAGTSTRHFESLELRSETPARDSSQIQRVALLTPDPAKPWNNLTKAVGGKVERAAPGGPSEYVQLLGHHQNHEMEVMQRIDLDRVNCVAVLVMVDVECSVSMELLQGPNGSDFRSHVTALPTGDPQLLQFDIFTDALKAKSRKRSMASGLRLKTRGKPGDFTIHSIDLLSKPAHLSLPSAEGGAGLIECGTDARLGVALKPGESVVASTRVPPGAQLRFSYSMPLAHRKDDAHPALELELRGADGITEQRSFSMEFGSHERWTNVSVPLGDYADSELEMSWRLAKGVESLAALVEVGVLSGEGPPQRVVLITSDTHRADHLGHADLGVEVRTPVLDQLADEGVTFENCFVATNVTNPSHIALMTGVHPRDTGVLNNRIPVNRNAETLAEEFRAAGYATYASISARHLSDPYSGLGQGFHRIQAPLDQPSVRADVTLDPLQDWLDRSVELPLFIWIHVYDAHTPYEPPPEITQTYFPVVSDAFDESLEPLKGKALSAHKKFPGLRDLEFPRALYRAEVTSLDWELGRVLNRPDLAQATVAFTADHGESLGEHGVYYAHSGLFPDTIHVPLILRHPEVPKGRRVSTPVTQLDVGRTLLDLAGLVDRPFPGRNLLAIEETEAGRPRYSIAAASQLASISIDEWHLVLLLNGQQTPRKKSGKPRKVSEDSSPERRHSVGLYDLNQDRHAAKNLLTKEFERAQAMRAQLIEWLRSTEDRGWRGEELSNKANLKDLAALGYASSGPVQVGSRDYFPADCDCGECQRFE